MTLKKRLEFFESSILTAYENNMTLREIAELYDCSSGTIRNFLLSKNVKLRNKGKARKRPILEVSSEEKKEILGKPELPEILE